MDRLLIEPSGPLHGTVEASAAFFAPRVTDVETMAAILEALGVRIAWQEDGRLVIHPNHHAGWTAPYELVSLMRASICVLGPLLAKHGRARVSLPGGCIIGPRPVDLHLKGLEALGAVIAVEHGDIVARAERLVGTTVHLGGPFGSSVLATDNVMMAATLADGTTVIEQAACEPEVVDLANVLISMGARISGHGTSRIQIEGVARLHGTHHRVIPDRIEVGTLLIAVGMAGGNVQIKGADPSQLGVVVEKLIEAGVMIEPVNGSMRVQSNRELKSVDVTTLPFPGFPTDLQAQITAMMAVSRGVSLVREKIYPERFMHVPELKRMGAKITREGPSVIIQGVEELSGAPVKATDLRASAALVLAGLVADKQTVLHGVEHLDRGYQRLEEKLARLGARIRREEVH